MPNENALCFAVPKGRILEELVPLLKKAGIEPEPAFFDEHSRQLQFSTNHKELSIIRVRSFDVATFVAFGAAQMGIVGSDVLMEFDYPDLYAPLDLGIGKCRLSVAEPVEDGQENDPRRGSHLRIATKYPNLTKQYFSARGVQAECIKLNGAMELAPGLGLCRRIVDLVSTGNTLRANGLKETETILEISSRLIVYRGALKTRHEQMNRWLRAFEKAAGHGA